MQPPKLSPARDSRRGGSVPDRPDREPQGSAGGGGGFSERLSEQDSREQQELGDYELRQVRGAKRAVKFGRGKQKQKGQNRYEESAGFSNAGESADTTGGANALSHHDDVSMGDAPLAPLAPSSGDCSPEHCGFTDLGQ